MSLSRADQLGYDLVKLIKRVIDENEEIEQAAKALAAAHGESVTIRLGIEAEVILGRDEDDEEPEDGERFPYGATLSLTERDENFLKAMRVTL